MIDLRSRLADRADTVAVRAAPSAHQRAEQSSARIHRDPTTKRTPDEPASNPGEHPMNDLQHRLTDLQSRTIRALERSQVALDQREVTR